MTGYDAAMARRRPTEPARADEIAQERPGTKHEAAHSGRLLLRMPQSLHAALARAADSEGVSLNQFINSALSSSIGWRAPDGATTTPHEKRAPAPAAEPSARPPRSWGRRVLLTINLVVLLLLAILAIVLLLTAWHQG